MDLQQPCRKLELESLDKLDSSWVSIFDPSKKKKKTKKGKPLVREDDILLHKAPHFEPDYGYEELLSRAFGLLLEEEDIDVSSTDRPRTVMMSPRLLAEGTQTTFCVNFAHLCRTMRRKPGHVMSFLLGQMETKGLLDKQQRLEMQGLVSSKDFQAVFRRYIDAFVICTCCKSPDTALAEDNGLFTLRCDMCGLVASIEEPNPL